MTQENLTASLGTKDTQRGKGRLLLQPLDERLPTLSFFLTTEGAKRNNLVYLHYGKEIKIYRNGKYRIVGIRVGIPGL
jgi:hypothetical protein